MWTPRRHRTAAVHRPTTNRRDQKNLALPSLSIQPQTFNKIIKPKATLKARKRKNIILPRAWTSWLAGSSRALSGNWRNALRIRKKESAGRGRTHVK